MYSELLQKIEDLQATVETLTQENEVSNKMLSDIHKALFNPPKKKINKEQKDNRADLRATLIKEHTRKK
jgi:exoribonuclease R